MNTFFKMVLLGVLVNTMPLVYLAINPPANPWIWLFAGLWVIIAGFLVTFIVGHAIMKAIELQFETPESRKRLFEKIILSFEEYGNKMETQERLFSNLFIVIMAGTTSQQVLKLLHNVITDPKLLTLINKILESERHGTPAPSIEHDISISTGKPVDPNNDKNQDEIIL